MMRLEELYYVVYSNSCDFFAVICGFLLVLVESNTANVYQVCYFNIDLELFDLEKTLRTLVDGCSNFLQYNFAREMQMKPGQMGQSLEHQMIALPQDSVVSQGEMFCYEQMICCSD
jgi:hypothetical protein